MLDKSAPVFVTGASGFIASYIVKDLLAAGYRVRGSVRSLARRETYAHLLALPGAGERLELVEADLLAPGVFDGPVQGCQTVMHTASPYVMDVKDPQKDLVDPALLGTRNVLGACHVAGVKRVILTSSMAAITDEPENDRVLSENDWNEKSSLARNPYYYSKMLAEREAWKLTEGACYELVVINPFIVIGPALSPALNTSTQIFADILSGVYPGIMSLTWGFVDVRDVARAHVLAMEKESAQGRYLCAHERMSMREVVALLRREGYDGHKLPRLGFDCAAGSAMVRLGSYLQPRGVGSYLRTHVGRVPQYDNGKVQRELGLSFRPLESSIKETVADLVQRGHVKPAA